MAIFLGSKSLYYKDVNLIAQPQRDLVSRSEVPQELHRFIVAPMEAVVGKKFAMEAMRTGLQVCLHRFGSWENQRAILWAIRDELGDNAINKRLWVAVGLNDLKRVEYLGHCNVLLDVANGYLEAAVQFAKHLQQKNYNLMVGNVHSATGINLYSNCLIRIGIGNSAVCRTGEVTGFNRGQITEITECFEKRIFNTQKIVADGGIVGSGEAAKAFGLGADFSMLGGYFKTAEESENVQKGEYKYWGGASLLQQKKQYGEIRRHAEGREIEVDKSKIRPLKELVKDLWGGVASAVSYSGYSSLKEFIGNGIFEVKGGGN